MARTPLACLAMWSQTERAESMASPPPGVLWALCPASRAKGWRGPPPGDAWHVFAASEPSRWRVTPSRDAVGRCGAAADRIAMAVPRPAMLWSLWLSEPSEAWRTPLSSCCWRCVAASRAEGILIHNARRAVRFGAASQPRRGYSSPTPRREWIAPARREVARRPKSPALQPPHDGVGGGLGSNPR